MEYFLLLMSITITYNVIRNITIFCKSFTCQTKCSDCSSEIDVKDYHC